MTTNTIHAASAESKLIFARIVKMAVGDTITYKELSAVAHVDVQKKRNVMYTALRMAGREHGMEFDAVMGVGLQRLDDSGTADKSRSYLHRSHRSALRSVKIASRVDITKLPQQRRFEHLAGVSIAGAVVAATRQSSLKKIEAKVSQTNLQLAMQETLEALGR